VEIFVAYECNMIPCLIAY